MAAAVKCIIVVKKPDRLSGLTRNEEGKASR